ncbi:cyclophilin-like fold protein [Paenibacillus luteus]|uniref:cyclophilin-like fold protein n=1 Tax=Paenibacillus luteus TaxID=2545753 RepID=UPI001142BECF|nr:cyclophilin-like fold protein [Paenibacillus luteus]
MGKSLKLTLDGREFTAVLNENLTVDDLLNMLPLELTLQRYAGHEYMSHKHIKTFFFRDNKQ